MNSHICLYLQGMVLLVTYGPTSKENYTHLIFDTPQIRLDYLVERIYWKQKIITIFMDKESNSIHNLQSLYATNKY